jgi:hypothetical protein
MPLGVALPKDESNLWKIIRFAGRVGKRLILLRFAP